MNPLLCEQPVKCTACITDEWYPLPYCACDRDRQKPKPK